MRGQEFRVARKQRGWTQMKTAQRLGISQPYLALVENGKRELGPKLTEKAVKVLKLRPTVLPLREKTPGKVNPQSLARQFASLGYPGFAYLRATRKRNPAEVLLTALAQNDLESRLTEALPWLLLHYADMSPEWLVEQARLHNLSNRLGFVVTLAKGAAARRGDTTSMRHQALDRLEAQLRESRLDKEDTLCQSTLSQREREWLKETRPAEAAYWHLLTDWRPEHLQYAF
ncbi:MAG TPA: helix-turn-helix transcriptional regulator [Terriglobales bacterium]|nr:helix-turn-helix transcriptional regulator [Terriglobales bacterium]